MTDEDTHVVGLARSKAEPAYSEEHYRRLLEGQEAWRDWVTNDLGGWEAFTQVNPRAAHRLLNALATWNAKPPRQAELEGANLCHAQLTGADLRGARLAGADLQGARLAGADLRNADLAGADLRGASLEGALLAGANLRGASLDLARLKGANLERAQLEGADLTLADLEEAKLHWARLEGATLERARLLNANLLEARLGGANLVSAQLAGACLRGAHLAGANLLGARLERADLVVARMEGADLREASLKGALLLQTTLEDVDLRAVTGLRLDSTMVRAARFSPRARDRWSVLRRTYTGPRFGLVLLLLVAFALPYVAKTITWVAANRGQTLFTEMLSQVLNEAQLDLLRSANRVQAELDTLESTSSPQAILVEVAGEYLRAGVGQVATVNATIQARLPREGSEHWRTFRVWELLLSLDRGSWLLVLTAALVLLYNALRAVLTLALAPMRDEEERSGYTPAYDRSMEQSLLHVLGREVSLSEWLDSWFEAYGWLWPLHRLTFWLFWVAAASFAYHAFDWLFMTSVYLPA